MVSVLEPQMVESEVCGGGQHSSCKNYKKHETTSYILTLPTLEPSLTIANSLAPPCHSFAPEAQLIMPALSKSAALLTGLLAPTVSANPLGLSIPGGLIPAIPGVTEALGSIVPPLPILQAPTPALPSEPFSGSDIKPKKIGYFWTGSGDDQHKDFLATVSLDDVSGVSPYPSALFSLGDGH